MPRQEKKVASLLTKKGINNYYPLNKLTGQNLNSKKKVKTDPLLQSFVFVYIAECELYALKKIPGVINFIFWKSKPAIISEEEIDVLQQFTSVYQNIRLEKSNVSLSGMVRVVDDPVISFKENSATIRFQTLKVILPSLGYTMIAEREKVSTEVLKLVNPDTIFNKQVGTSFLSN
jgi:transcription antitermination factor NusG